MRAKEFIVELEVPGGKTYTQVASNTESPRYSKELLNEMISKIKTECAPFIKNNYGDLFSLNCLYRGVSARDKTMHGFIKGTQRSDRRPKDSPTRWHNIFNTYLMDEFNTPYRSSAIFASPSFSLAATFGAVYSIFPIGNYKLCYSPIIDDPTEELLTPTFNPRLIAPLDNYGDISIALKQLDLVDDSFDKDAVWETVENLWKSYYAGNTEFEELLMRFIFPAMKYQESLSYNSVHGEVMLYAPNGYYGIQVSGAAGYTKNDWTPVYEHIIKRIIS